MRHSSLSERHEAWTGRGACIDPWTSRPAQDHRPVYSKLLSSSQQWDKHRLQSGDEMVRLSLAFRKVFDLVILDADLAQQEDFPSWFPRRKSQPEWPFCSIGRDARGGSSPSAAMALYSSAAIRTCSAGTISLASEA